MLIFKVDRNSWFLFWLIVSIDCFAYLLKYSVIQKTLGGLAHRSSHTHLSPMTLPGQTVGRPRFGAWQPHLAQQEGWKRLPGWGRSDLCDKLLQLLLRMLLSASLCLTLTLAFWLSPGTSLFTWIPRLPQLITSATILLGLGLVNLASMITTPASSPIRIPWPAMMQSIHTKICFKKKASFPMTPLDYAENGHLYHLFYANYCTNHSDPGLTLPPFRVTHVYH